MAASVTSLSVRKPDNSSIMTPLPYKQHAKSRFRRSKGRYRININNGKLPNSTPCGLWATTSDNTHVDLPVVLDTIVTNHGTVTTALNPGERIPERCEGEKMECGYHGLETNVDGDDPRKREKSSCAWTMRSVLMALFEPAENKLAMKLFGNRNALMKERLRQRATKNWVIHPCSYFR